MTVKVLIHKADEGGFWAEVPSLPGCVSQGENLDELKINVKEAIEGWMLAGEDKIDLTNKDVVIEISV
jgi:predicted RNase H-like HicB family nuclease